MKNTPSYLLRTDHKKVREDASEIRFPYPTIGIIGGMGPDATADLYAAINRITREKVSAKLDREYVPVLIASYPQVPDRVRYILHTLGKLEEDAADPFPYLVKAYLDLKGKVKYIGIPCNTAHFFVPALQEFITRDGSDIEIVHMIEETERALKFQNPEIKRVGILATTGTLETELYHRVLEERGFEVLQPDSHDQESLVMDAIYGYQSGKGIKGGYVQEPREKLKQAAENLREMGAESIIAGCTEIPLALTQDDIPEVLYVNPTEVLARRLVELTLREKDDR